MLRWTSGEGISSSQVLGGVRVWAGSGWRVSGARQMLVGGSRPCLFEYEE